MSGRLSREKGAGAEREVAALLGLGRNARNGLAAGDLTMPEGYAFYCEVKRRARAYGSLYQAIEQAEGYGVNPTAKEMKAHFEDEGPCAVCDGKTPIAIVRDDRHPWLVVMRLSDALRIVPGLKIAKEGE